VRCVQQRIGHVVHVPSAMLGNLCKNVLTFPPVSHERCVPSRGDTHGSTRLDELYDLNLVYARNVCVLVAQNPFSTSVPSPAALSPAIHVNIYIYVNVRGAQVGV